MMRSENDERTDGAERSNEDEKHSEDELMVLLLARVAQEHRLENAVEVQPQEKLMRAADGTEVLVMDVRPWEGAVGFRRSHWLCWARELGIPDSDERSYRFIKTVETMILTERYAGETGFNHSNVEEARTQYAEARSHGEHAIAAVLELAGHLDAMPPTPELEIYVRAAGYSRSALVDRADALVRDLQQILDALRRASEIAVEHPLSEPTRPGRPQSRWSKIHDELRDLLGELGIEIATSATRHALMCDLLLACGWEKEKIPSKSGVERRWQRFIPSPTKLDRDS